MPLHILASKDLVLTEKYALETILQSIKDKVKDAGVVKLSFIADEYKVPQEFIQDLLLADEELMAAHKLESGQLMSLETEQNQLKQYIESIKALDVPTSIDTIVENLGIISSHDKEKLL